MPLKRLLVGTEAAVCVKVVFSTNGDAGLARPETAGLAVRDALTSALDERGQSDVQGGERFSGSRVILSPGAEFPCDVSLGDVVATVAVHLNRPAESYTIDLSAEGRGARFTHHLVRTHVMRRPPKIVLPDDPGPGFDWEGLQYDEMIRLDGLRLGQQLAEGIVVENGP